MANNRKSRVSATEARVHFGEMMRRAEGGETLVVERAGEPKVVMMSIEHYGRLDQGRDAAGLEDVPAWQRKLEEVREKASRELAGKEIDWEQIIREAREERSRQIFETLEAVRPVRAADRDATDHE